MTCSRPPLARAARLAACLAVAAAACSPAAPSASDTPNVLLILIDTLRADRLGIHGNQRGLSPSIDRLAGAAVVFEQASAHAPWTLPSTASLLTGRLPAQHGAGGHLGAFSRLDQGVPTIQGHFRRAGYATAAVVNVSFLGPEFGLARGFEHHDLQAFESNHEVRRADATTEAALTWLRTDRGGRPFFLLAHYFDPHAVYDPPQPYRRRFALEPDRELGAESGGQSGAGGDFVFGTREDLLALRTGRLQLVPETLRRAEALYDAEVAFTDAEVGRLLDGLEELGLAGDTLVVLTADHGEEFLDHGGFEHGHTLYAELTHVPLVLRAPGLDAGRVSTGVGLIDVAPTLCELAGLDPLPGAAGRSLTPLLRSHAGAERSVLAHGNFWGPPLTSWRAGPEKLILNAAGSGRRAELYRWREDPDEQRNLAPEQSERAALLAAELEAVLATLEQGAGDAVELDPLQRRELEALGYLGARED